MTPFAELFANFFQRNLPQGCQFGHQVDAVPQRRVGTKGLLEKLTVINSAPLSGVSDLLCVVYESQRLTGNT